MANDIIEQMADMAEAYIPRKYGSSSDRTRYTETWTEAEDIAVEPNHNTKSLDQLEQEYKDIINL